ncbi:DUF2946 family protein [Zemynaea arenosa]|uniref:DUF2946 family protein n=1 Tax=Zemynaea arenosa TaxID=2561931 RepID=UPI00142F8155|nr:DUF2946 family protein [Massilia arenosa]
MRRFFAILLLLIVPLQFSWAAASIACTHESGKGSMHFGHHIHVHKAHSETKDDKGAGGAAKKPPGSDSDCPFCHAFSASPNGESLAGLPADINGDPVSSAIELHPNLHPDLPERPNWLSAS